MIEHACTTPRGSFSPSTIRVTHHHQRYLQQVRTHLLIVPNLRSLWKQRENQLVDQAPRRIPQRAHLEVGVHRKNKRLSQLLSVRKSMQNDAKTVMIHMIQRNHHR